MIEDFGKENQKFEKGEKSEKIKNKNFRRVKNGGEWLRIVNEW